MRLTVLCVLLLLAGAAPASAQDSDAPEDAAPYWLPNEPWVMEHWLPYDEQRLHALLRTSRAGLWRYLADERRTVAAFARRRGWRPETLARELVEPWRDRVSKRRFEVLRSRALRTLTQGHLAQHLLFHSLHQGTLPAASSRVFGVRDAAEFADLRRAQLSALHIAALNGRGNGVVEHAATAALRATARRGVRAHAVTKRQARLLLARQLRYLPRWLRRAQMNSRRGSVLMRRSDRADAPVLTADGGAIAYEAYDVEADARRRDGVFSVTWRQLAAPAGRRLRVDARQLALAGDGSVLAYEMSSSHAHGRRTFGGPAVVVREMATGRDHILDHAARDDSATYAPSVSHDGTRVAFERADLDKASARAYVCDLRTGATVLASRADGPDGAAPSSPVLGSALSGDGRTLAFATRPSGSRESAIFLRDLDAGRTIEAGVGDAGAPSLSYDGGVVAFIAVADGAARVAVRDMGSGTLTRVGPRGAWAPALSADGRTVAFVAGRHPVVYAADVVTGAVERISAPGHWAVEPAISADGRVVAYAADGAGDSRAVYVRDRATTVLRRVAGGPET
jgi:WD40-like Beta Propeller Repeat